MRVTVIGTGYVGTVTGVCLSYLGHHVTCIDVDAEKIGRLQRGDIPIYEPGLAELLKLAAGRSGKVFKTQQQKIFAKITWEHQYPISKIQLSAGLR